MFTLLSVEVRHSPLEGYGPYVSIEEECRTRFDPSLSAKIEPNVLYRIPDCGWFGWTVGSEKEVVLYLKLDEQAGGGGHFLAVTEERTCHFGRIIPNALRPTGDGVHEHQWNESGAVWGWLPEQDGEETEAFEVPEFIRGKLSVPA